MNYIMKTRVLFLIFILTQIAFGDMVHAQALPVSPELKELIELSLNKDRQLTNNEIDKSISLIQLKAIRSSYIPKLEFGGKYLYASSSFDSDFGDFTGFENISQIQAFMATPTFPTMFPNLASLTNEISQLKQLMAMQGLMPSVSNDFDGSFNANYYGFDVMATMLLYSGGLVPNTAKALNEKIKAQEALTDKSKSDVISEVITYYDQLALLIQSKQVLDESVTRLAAEKKYASLALKNGFATSFDTIKIAAANANLNAKLAKYESKKTLLYQKLSQLTGKSVSSFEASNPALDILLYINDSSDINNRAELRALTAGAEAKKYLLKASKSNYLPKVQAFASARTDNIFNSDIDFDSPLAMGMDINNFTFGPTVMVGVGFKWDLINFSAGSKQVKQAKLELKKAENTREEARELLELNQTKAITNYKAAVSQVSFKAKQREAARMALDLAQKSYNEGVINITERLAAETEMQKSELEYLQAVFTERQSALECYKATGDLTITNIQ